MDRIEIGKLSAAYDVRRLGLADAPVVYAFCKADTQYYARCGAGRRKNTKRDTERKGALCLFCCMYRGAAVRQEDQSLSSLRTAMNASVGTCTVPRFRIFFLPSFCFSSSFFLRVMSPP